MLRNGQGFFPVARVFQGVPVRDLRPVEGGSLTVVLHLVDLHQNDVVFGCFLLLKLLLIYALVRDYPAISATCLCHQGFSLLLFC